MNLHDDYIVLKPVGFMDFINSDRLRVLTKKNQEIIVFRDYKFSNELNNSFNRIVNPCK